MEPNKRDYDFLAGGEIEVRKNGKLVFRPIPEQVQAHKNTEDKKKRPRKAKPQERVIQKVYMNLSIQKPI